MKVGILGFPKTGKTTVFNALTASDVPTDKFGGRAGKVNVGMAKVRDERLPVLAEMYQPKKVTPATVEYVDVPGFEPGSGGLSGYLAEFRGADAVMHVIRAFEDPEIALPFDGGIDPARDAGAMEDELLLADLALVETRLERIAADLKKRKDKELEAERDVLERFRPVLEEQQPLRSRDWPAEDLARTKGMALLTLKPMLHLVNFGEEATSTADGVMAGLGPLADAEKTGVARIFGRIEAEIAQLSRDDALAFLEDLGLSEPTADRVAAASYALLDLISFLTAGEQEVRAWPITKGMTARKAAGRIHSDIERGFIRAELVAFDDLVAAGSWSASRDRGTLRLEGKEYVVKDGDVILFRFNV